METRQLTWYLLRRLAALGALLCVVSFVVFALLHIAPGSPEQILLGDRPATPAVINAVRNQYHLTDPFVLQYWRWLGNAVHLNFGESIRTNEPVRTALASRLGLTVPLGLYAFVLTMALGVPLGVLAAYKQRRAVDRLVVAGSVVGVSAPAFASGIVLIYVFAVVIGWFPAFGQGSGLADRAWHLTLPAFALAATATALIVKLTRASVISVLDQDYVTFARARGLAPRRITISYVLRNAFIPIVTASGLVLAYMLSGAILIEVTFGLPGLGSLLVDSVNSKDIPMVQGIAILVALVVGSVNLITDVAYFGIDPRTRRRVS